jgi:hypothetical protein
MPCSGVLPLQNGRVAEVVSGKTGSKARRANGVCASLFRLHVVLAVRLADRLHRLIWNTSLRQGGDLRLLEARESVLLDSGKLVRTKGYRLGLLRGLLNACKLDLLKVANRHKDKERLHLENALRLADMCSVGRVKDSRVRKKQL